MSEYDPQTAYQMEAHYYEKDKMRNRLPYVLTTGITATREGLQFRSPLMVTVEYFRYDIETSIDEPLTISWPDVAERLQYREGLPSIMYDAMYNDIFLRESSWNFIDRPERLMLHRLAAILFDGVEGFKILYWCIHNYKAI